MTTRSLFLNIIESLTLIVKSLDIKSATNTKLLVANLNLQIITQRNRKLSYLMITTVTKPFIFFQISEDIGSDELIRRLKTLAHTFQTLGQV
jgi:hypothetical protein